MTFQAFIVSHRTMSNEINIGIFSLKEAGIIMKVYFRK